MQLATPPITETTHHAATLSKYYGFGQPHGTHFSQLLDPQDAATDRTPKAPDDELKEAASSLVAITLIQPLLAQAREDPFKSELFHGGFAEDAFGEKLDAIIAERIAKATRFPIVDAVYNSITKTGTGTKVNTHG